MLENIVSQRTKQANILMAKRKPFQVEFQDSRSRVQRGSSLHNLAGSTYSYQRNKEMSPRKTLSKSGSLSRINPEMGESMTLSGLNMRASHIPNYSDLNTQLILERKRLQEKIRYLKEETAAEKRKLAKAEINCKKNQNGIDRAQNSLNQLNLKSERLNENIHTATHDCSVLRHNLNSLRRENLEKEKQKNEQEEHCRNLGAQCYNLKNSLMDQDKQRIHLKADLISQQKVMTGQSILQKEREQERAVLMLQINKYVAANRL